MTWRDDAACVGSDPMMFDPIDGSGRNLNKTLLTRVRSAVAVCNGCPVRLQCEAEGVQEARYGVWGGRLMANGEPVTYERSRPVEECGTERAWQRHARRHEKACQLCVNAHWLELERRRASKRRADRQRRFDGVA